MKGGADMRVSKPPEERRQEILDTAMRLFSERGYEEVSMADIAKELKVVPGLCYRYFDSKRVLFREAMEQYGRECAAMVLPVLRDRSRTIRERLDAIAGLILRSEGETRWRTFYHRPENRHLHLQLSGEICESLLPYVTEELQAACRSGELHLSHPEVTASFLLYGQVGLLGESEVPLETRVDLIRRYADRILDAE